MSNTIPYAQTSDFDPAGPTSRFWIDISLREIRLLQMHNSVLSRMRDFVTETHQDGDARSKLLASFPGMEERSSGMLRDAREMFKVARAYEGTVHGEARGDTVTREMAEGFAAQDAGVGETNAGRSTTRDAPHPTSNAAAQPQPMPQLGGSGPSAWQSSLPTKRPRDDETNSDSPSTSHKRQRTRSPPSGIGEKRASAEPLQTISEEGYSNKRRRVDTPPSDSSPTTLPSSPHGTSQSLSKLKRDPTDDDREFTAQHYGPVKRQRMSSASTEPEAQRDGDPDDLDAEVERRLKAVEMRRRRKAHEIWSTNKRKIIAEESEDDSLEGEARGTKRTRNSQAASDADELHTFATVETVETPLQ
ncbi:MAG: hypothetical protein M1828_006043 [Chrysothrix sp. TS-e1954]|nr:MAG: hypothetical protein M1828_006043 [Chrysothrix sp. TS-e1954]